MAKENPAPTQTAPEAAAVAAPEVSVKRPKKLSKVINGNVLTITDSETKTILNFDASTLPEAIQKLLMPYGLSQKIGDAAAGKTGQVAVDAMKKVWEGLQKNDWSVRVPKGDTVSVNEVLAKVNAMPEGKEKAQYMDLLKKVGIIKE